MRLNYLHDEASLFLLSLSPQHRSINILFKPQVCAPVYVGQWPLSRMAHNKRFSSQWAILDSFMSSDFGSKDSILVTFIITNRQLYDIITLQTLCGFSEDLTVFRSVSLIASHLSFVSNTAFT